jgi:predicted alpha/beta hydrolase family esterase
MTLHFSRKSRIPSGKNGKFLYKYWRKGHLNSESQLEYWEEGQEILQSLVHMIEENK